MITLREELFVNLVVGKKTYVIVDQETKDAIENSDYGSCLLYTSPSPRD